MLVARLARAISACTSNASRTKRSYSFDQRRSPSSARISEAVSRKSEPATTSELSRTASTPSSFAMSASRLLLPLYDIADVGIGDPQRAQPRELRDQLIGHAIDEVRRGWRRPRGSPSASRRRFEPGGCRRTTRARCRTSAPSATATVSAAAIDAHTAHRRGRFTSVCCNSASAAPAV